MNNFVRLDENECRKDMLTYLADIDILKFLRIEQRKCFIKDWKTLELPCEEEDIKRLFKNILEYSFRGYFNYNYIEEIKNHTTMLYSPIEFFVDWCKSIMNCCHDRLKRRYSKIYKDFVIEHFNIDGFDRQNKLIKNGQLLWKTCKTFDFLKELCKFDIEELANKGYIDGQVFEEKFCNNKKYYLVNAFNPCYYDKEYSFDEVKNLIEKYKKYCSITKDGFISICNFRPGIGLKYWFANLIIADDMFNDMKYIVDELDEAIKASDVVKVKYIKHIYNKHTFKNIELKNKIDRFLNRN